MYNVYHTRVTKIGSQVLHFFFFFFLFFGRLLLPGFTDKTYMNIPEGLETLVHLFHAIDEYKDPDR